MVLLLGGGGDAQQERPVLDRFVELAGATSIAYWPFALNLVDYANATSFAEAALGRPVQTWTSLDEHSTSDVQECGGVFIGGGNTYHLLSEVRRTGFDEVLRDCARTRLLYGGSAGAIMFGSDIGTAGYFDSNDAGLVETKGLGLLGPYAVWCHYEDGHAADLRDWARSTERPVIVLTERSGAEVAGNDLSSIGHEPVLLLSPDGTLNEVAPGQSRRFGD
jgi:dipeptidase E